MQLSGTELFNVLQTSNTMFKHIIAGLRNDEA